MKKHVVKLPDATTGQEAATIVDEKQLRKLIPLSRRTLFNLRRSGKLPFINAGGRRNLYHVPSVTAAFLRMQKNGVSE